MRRYVLSLPLSALSLFLFCSRSCWEGARFEYHLGSSSSGETLQVIHTHYMRHVAEDCFWLRTSF